MTSNIAIGITIALAIGFAGGTMATQTLENKDYAHLRKLERETSPQCPRVQIDLKLWNKLENRWEHWCVSGREEADKRSRKMTY